MNVIASFCASNLGMNFDICCFEAVAFTTKSNRRQFFYWLCYVRAVKYTNCRKQQSQTSRHAVASGIFSLFLSPSPSLSPSLCVCVCVCLSISLFVCRAVYTVELCAFIEARSSLIRSSRSLSDAAVISPAVLEHQCGQFVHLPIIYRQSGRLHFTSNASALLPVLVCDVASTS